MEKQTLGIIAPQKGCADKKCPFHGDVTVKNEMLKGKVIKKDINRSATIEWFRPYYVPKYERYEIRRSRIRVHNPACINAGVGSEVLVAKTRPLSKTKNHAIMMILGGVSARETGPSSMTTMESSKEKGSKSVSLPKKGKTVKKKADEGEHNQL